MAWIVDVELVAVDEAEPPDVLEIVFDVIYPGETWTRSLVRVTGAALAAGAADGLTDGLTGGHRLDAARAVRRAREALLTVLEAEPAPASIDMRLTDAGTEILAKRRTDLR